MINDGDKIIREQLGSIEATPEHVVFDKEAAWSKLQGRLETKKRGVVLSFSYRWAAVAAVLLLVISIAMLRKPSGEKVVVNTVKKMGPVHQPLPVKVTAPEQKTAVFVEKPIQYKTSPKKETHTGDLFTIETNPPQEVIATVQPEEKHETPATTAPRMKVVHINELMSDLDREREEQAESRKHVAGGRNGFFLIKSISSPSLYDDTPSPQPFRIRFTQN